MRQELPGQLELPVPEPDEANANRSTLRGIVGLITPAELAKSLGIAEQTLATWRTNGEGPDFVKLGKGVFYRLQDLHTWIAARVTSVVTGGKSEPQKVAP